MDVTAFLRRKILESNINAGESREANINADFKSFPIVFLNCIYEILAFLCMVAIS